ncbi:MAG: hypothetical protein ACWGQW_13900, partial [bacterium]
MNYCLKGICITSVVALICTMTLAENLPASKANARTTATTVLDCEGITEGSLVAGCGTWKTVAGLMIRTPGNNKEFLVGGSGVSLLATLTKASSKGGSKGTATAEAGLMVRIVMDPVTSNAGADGTVASPGAIVFDRRLQELSATLEGQIADCLVLVDTNGDGIPDDIQLDEECVLPETIELLQETQSANHFNFILPDVSQGTHRIEFQAMATNLESTDGVCLDLEPGDCSAQATAMLGPISLTV